MTSLLDGLVAYWPLGETSGTRYDVLGNNHLLPWNAPGYADGKIGQAVVCAAAKALYHADNADLSTGNIDFTWSCWVYLTSKPGQYQGIVGKWHAGGSPNEFLLYHEPSNDRFLWEPGGYSVFANALGAPALNTWYHILVWHDASGASAGIRVNDAYQNVDTSGAAPPNSSDELNVGTFDNRNNTSLGFRGRIDELAFWKRLLTSAEKTALYNGGAGYSFPWGATLNRGSFRGLRQGIMRGV